MSSLITPPILFFFLGFIAAIFKSNIHIPNDIKKFLSIYLLISIGYKGGFQIYHNGIDTNGILVIIICMLFSFTMPFILYAFLQKWILKVRTDSVLIASSYSSVSAVTFITAINVLVADSVNYDGYMIVALTIMEFPAIIAGTMIYYLFIEKTTKTYQPTVFLNSVKESLLDYSVILLVGSLFIGFLCGDSGNMDMSPLTSSLFKGMLALFLLSMGISAGEQIGILKKAGVKLIAFAILMPIALSLLAILLGSIIHLGEGNTLLLAVLFGGASYIAVPAAMSETVKGGNIGLMVALALVITFVFNISVGIPIYLSILS
ncbi:sodium-dependent bicarbonate transport family permease [Allofrancisella frigidaquae]|uniref:Sodium-dependent bicarbonate transport family permease n=1 Tax=Allofrancisella frigidaquae TaxID=1085644 RepID=A0A6M3HVX0_9GAMM|nr:sodium-dependent bicarbonate transport family permease [Allofrancisella frigidaquae]QIV95250.1 sodium-dependent bicarbonate transport family permease [Allofrancisella frigidaquae]